MAKVSRSGGVRGKVGGDVYKVIRGRQVLHQMGRRKVPFSKSERRQQSDVGNLTKRFSMLPDGLKRAWITAGGSYSAPPHKLVIKQDTQKTINRLKIIHHIKDYSNGVALYTTCNSFAREAGFELPRDFPPDIGLHMPDPPRITGWRYDANSITVGLHIPSQIAYYNEKAVIVRNAFSGVSRHEKVKINGKKVWKRRFYMVADDQMVARAFVSVTPCDIELTFDKIHLGPSLGDKDVGLEELGQGQLTICANVIAAKNKYWGRVKRIPEPTNPLEPKELWGSLVPDYVEKLRREGKLKEGPLIGAVVDDDFIGGKLCGAFKSVNSNYLRITLNKDGGERLKKTGQYFKKQNQKRRPK